MKIEKRLKYILLLLIAAGSLLFIYYGINPEQSVWMPKCSFKMLTGLDCPACGSQRAMHAFLNGEFTKAMMFNPFLILSIPYFIAVIYTTFGRSRFAIALCRYVQHKYTIWGYAILFMVWWVARNIWFR